ncbi:MAG: hypothetical protein ABI639_03320 [Thermoanaerobaculia bacterium]
MPGIKSRVAPLKADVKKVKAGLSRSREVASEELDGLLSSLSEKVADVRSALASATEDGIETINDGVDSMVKKTRKGIKSLDKRWQKMDRKQKVAVAGGLLAVLAAAAAAPAIARRIKDR